MRLAPTIILLLVLFLPSFAFADGPAAAAVLNLEAEKVDALLAENLTAIVRNEALQVEKYQVVNEFPIKLHDVALLIGCSPESPSCLKQVATEVEAQVLIFGTVRSQENAAFQIELSIFDAVNGRMINRMTRTLSGDNVDPMVGFRQQIEAFFAEERGKAMTRLQIGASVDGARVLIDGAFIGVVPIERKGLPPATYEVEIEHPEYNPWSKDVELVPGADERVWAQLEAVVKAEPVAVAEPAAQPPVQVEELSPPPEPAPRSPNWGAWGALAVGGIALGTSVGFGIALEGVESKLENEAAQGELTEARYQELFDRGETMELAHRVTLGVGAVAAATGIIWLLLDRGGDSRASLSVTPSGVAASWLW